MAGSSRTAASRRSYLVRYQHDTSGGDEGLVRSGFPLITPEEIAEGVMRAITSEGTGEAWICQAGREPLSYEFRGVPGPR